MKKGIVKKTIVVWHDCDPCITRSLINYLNWIYYKKCPDIELDIKYLEKLREVGDKLELIKILEECEALIYSCRFFHNIGASTKEWEVIKNKTWYAVSEGKQEEEKTPSGLSIFSVKNITFIDREGLVKLMEDVRSKRSRK